jgi:HK97 family phage major capsid protein
MNEELLAKITELTNAVKENGGLNGLRKEELIADFKQLLDERDQKRDQTPDRKGEAGGPEIPHGAGYQVKGRYGRIVKDLEAHGEASVNGTPVKAIDLVLAKALMERAVATGQSGAVAPSADLVEAVKAMTTSGAATGAELVPENLAGTLWEDMYVASKIFADLPELPMTSDPQNIGLLGTMNFRKGTQNTATTADDLDTGEAKLTATELLSEVNWSYNLDEDAVVAMMPAFRQEAARAGAEYMDAFALNADATATSTGNINLDDDTPAADSYYLTAGQDGIRHQFLVDNTGQGESVGAALDDAKMALILNPLGKYGLDLANLRIVPDVATYLSMLALASVKTVDVYGPSATVVTGELARYRGIPVIPSPVMPLTEADGKACKTAASNVKGQLAAYNRLMWRRGSRRGLTIEIDRDIQKRQMILVVSFRIAVGCRGTRSAQKHTVGGYNISL